jgi:hypothetical protein
MVRKGRKPKYKVGDMVYSWQNPTVKRRVSHVQLQPSGFPPKYKVALYDKEGYSYSSKWMDEASLRKTKRRKK